MGLLSADLQRHRTSLVKSAFLVKADQPKEKRASAVDVLRATLEQYAGADRSIEKSASQEDHTRLYNLHRAVEASYREAVKAGKRSEADTELSKFSGWAYLKGQPGEEGDLHPFPVPAEK
jgi:hypothetical protein